MRAQAVSWQAVSSLLPRNLRVQVRRKGEGEEIINLPASTVDTLRPASDSQNAGMSPA